MADRRENQRIRRPALDTRKSGRDLVAEPWRVGIDTARLFASIGGDATQIPRQRTFDVHDDPGAANPARDRNRHLRSSRRGMHGRSDRGHPDFGSTATGPARSASNRRSRPSKPIRIRATRRVSRRPRRAAATRRLRRPRASAAATDFPPATFPRRSDTTRTRSRPAPTMTEPRSTWRAATRRSATKPPP